VPSWALSPVEWSVGPLDRVPLRAFLANTGRVFFRHKKLILIIPGAKQERSVLEVNIRRSRLLIANTRTRIVLRQIMLREVPLVIVDRPAGEGGDYIFLLRGHADV
jgi:hypothetical protein